MPFQPPTPKRRTRLTALLSIHDVAPSTLSRTLDVVHLLKQLGIGGVTLLVVPGGPWTGGQLDTLRELERSRFELAGHGWTHRCSGISSWTHRVHSLLISRNLAEHLCLSPEEILGLIDRCYGWFPSVGLKEPRLYVPPAWGMGPVTRRLLSGGPFHAYEYLSGIYDVPSGSFTRLPLVGFEADNHLRRYSLRAWNAVNSAIWRVSALPLRIAIHPFDLDYYLVEDLKALLKLPIRFCRYCELVAEAVRLREDKVHTADYVAPPNVTVCEVYQRLASTGFHR